MSRLVWAGLLLLASFGSILTSCQQKGGKKVDLPEPRESIIGRIDSLERVLLNEDVALNDAAAAQVSRTIWVFRSAGQMIPSAQIIYLRQPM